MIYRDSYKDFTIWYEKWEYHAQSYAVNYRLNAKSMEDLKKKIDLYLRNSY